MDTTGLKKFAQEARTTLRAQISSKLDLVLAPESAARRESPKAVRELESEIAATSRDQVVEKVAYTWFNRFTALRFMDAIGLNERRVVSPADGESRPEILSEALAGSLPEALSNAVAASIRALLEGWAPSQDPQGEAYRLLLVAACNAWHDHMPFMFEEIADYTELLLPDDLLSAGSLLARIREVMTVEACQDVEIIGWLYQFYISEKKDEVFAGLKKNQKITAENIPAATQLFTPHWIVRYLVENSLGRLWLLNRPASKLAERMDYYIAPEEPETDFLRIASPEEIKICDPACGSGHMLTYAFDLLFAIYEEEGYDANEIPGLILKNNLHGIEIDDRAGALASFALSMKAAAKLGRRRWQRMSALPNICVMQNVSFTQEEIAEYMATLEQDLFTEALQQTLGQFGQAKNLGALVVPKMRAPAEFWRLVEEKDFSNNLFLRNVHSRVVQVLQMTEALSPKYGVVVANPPYAASKGLNEQLNSYLEVNFPDSKFDLMTAFMDRVGLLTADRGFYAMINFPSWMFLGSFDRMRAEIIRSKQILALSHLGRGMFGSDFGSVAFVVQNTEPKLGFKGEYRRLFEQHVDVRKPEVIESLYLKRNYNRYLVNQENFESIPGRPIAYWISEQLRSAFSRASSFEKVAEPRKGITTSDNERFLRLWFEISTDSFSATAKTTRNSKWFPINKGGAFRRWYGNRDVVINWKDNGAEIKKFDRSVIRNENFYFREGMTWNDITSGTFAMRYSPSDAMFEGKGPMAFAENYRLCLRFIAFFNTKVSRSILSILAPTINFNIGDVARVPIIPEVVNSVVAEKKAEICVGYAKSDWDAFETSSDFSSIHLLNTGHRTGSIIESYNHLRQCWKNMTSETQRLEEENNRIFIDAYGLQDELTPEVSIEEITLACNPAYRYGMKGSEEDRETRLLADTIAEFLSYAVGCMFGRYSLDATGLILANQGEGLEEYLVGVPNPTFMPDADNVIPMLDDEWFPDDVTERFRKFLMVTFGEGKFAENLAFIEKALGKDIRKYFTRDFFNDHVKRYKKRPIYWLFSSPKGTFNALIYMHRYRPDTVSVLLNDYLREFRSKLEARKVSQEKLSISADATQGQRTAAIKEIQTLTKQIDELDAWERDVIYPLASRKIEIDLDDGVKVNYQKFEGALKPIKGLSDADD